MLFLFIPPTIVKKWLVPLYSFRLLFEKVGLTEDDAITQAQMAYILRNKDDYNFKTKEVKIWQPTK